MEDGRRNRHSRYESLESRVRGNSQARFGKGRMEKDRQWHLVSRLLHSARAEG